MPFEFQIEDYFNYSPERSIFAGSLISGRIEKGDTGVIEMENLRFVLSDIHIEFFRKQIDWLEAPQRNVGILFIPEPKEAFRELIRQEGSLPFRGYIVRSI